MGVKVAIITIGKKIKRRKTELFCSGTEYSDYKFSH